MSPRRNSPIERTMMAIPALIVLIITGSTLMQLAGETFVSSLSSTSLIPSEWSPAPGKKMKRPKVDEFDLILGKKPEVPEEETLFLGPKPKVPTEDSLILNHNLIPTPVMSRSELAARDKVIKHLGGEEKLQEIEEDMGAAFSAAENSLSSRGIYMNDLETITIIDFTKPSYARRMVIFHPQTGDQTRHLVAHGTKSGKLYATSLSNRRGSHQSSPGLYQIGVRYNGSHGAALRLHGLDPGINDNVYRRHIVLHSAWYVSYKAILRNIKKEGVPRIGRSHGCPAVHRSDLDYVIGKLTTGTYLYIHTDL